MRKYGLNTVSLWPWSLGSFGPFRSIEMASKAGFDGIQALPMRLWDYRFKGDWARYVISYEDAWNYGPLWKALLREIGLMGEPAPTLLDLFLFGRERMLPFPNAIFSVHHGLKHPPKTAVVTEIHPELWTDTQSYVDYSQLRGRLCWDTWHVRRPHRKTGATIGSWRELLILLPAEAIGLIHVHPTKEEIPGFLRGESSELTAMLVALRLKNPNCPAIIEVFPPLAGKIQTIAFVANILRITKGWLS